MRILIFGQIPPPHHGQSIMISHLLNAKMEEIEFYHVRLRYSQTLTDIGKASLYKIVELSRVIICSAWIVITKKIDAVYYPPAGRGYAAILRDIITLVIVRRIYRKKIILHFHAMGLLESYQQLNRINQFFFKKAFFLPTAAVCLSSLNLKEVEFLKPIKTFVVPYGIMDEKKIATKDVNHSVIRILFVGNIIESKGVFVLLDAALALIEQGYVFELIFVGGFISKETEKKFFSHTLIKKHSICKYHGVLTGEAKWQQYLQADIFCFPTFYESENFCVVLLEALQFSLPVVSTFWRGIPSIIENEVEGYLVNPKDADLIAEKLKILIVSKEAREEMGKKGRLKFLQKFTLNQYLSGMREVFLKINED